MPGESADPLHQLPVGGQPVDLQAHPDLERLEGAGELRAVLGEVAQQRVVHHRVVRGDAGEHPAQVVPVPHQHATCLHRHEQQLVRVERERVGPLDAGEQRCHRRRQHAEPPEGAIDVQPHLLAPAEIGERVDRVDGRRGDGAGVGHHAERRESGLPVGANALFERLDIDPELVVSGKAAVVPAPETEQHEGLVHGIVGLLRGIDGERRAGHGVCLHALLPGIPGRMPLAGGRETDQVGDRTAGGDQPVRRLLEPEQRLEPADHGLLDGVGGGRELPDGAVLVEHRRERLGQDGGHGRRAVDIGQEAG